MRRTLVQFDAETYLRLRQQAFRQQRSIASLVREMVAKGLDGETVRERPTRARDFSSVASGRSAPGWRSRVSEKHDEALSDTFGK
jgi:plasmid stability protein